MRAIGRTCKSEARQKSLITGVMLLTVLLGMSLAAHGADTITLRPSSLAFGAMAVGRSSALSVTATNNNRRSVEIAGMLFTSPVFSYSGLTLPATVLPGQSVTISVTLNPTAIQGYTGKLTFVLSDGSKPTVTLSGSGTAPAAVAPLITSQPAGQTVTAGQTVSFQATASGTAPLSYQWKKNGVAISGATSPAYTTPATTGADNGAQFSVTVSNAAGSASSGSASLTVSTPVTAPQITSQPAGQTVTAGQTASFQATASGTAPLSYQWMKNGAAISGATSPAYTTAATTAADNGAQFSVTVSNTAGSASSGSASLTVSTPVTAPLITSQPAGQTVTAGQTASFSVSASGTAPLSYQWMKNGAAIGGGNSSSYTTPASTTTDNGAQFTVAVSNTAGSATSSGATLNVNAATSCLVSSLTAWTNTAVATQAGVFTASYDATPGQAGMDGVVGFSQGAATGYGSLAAITRFNPTGTIDAMSGGGYGADVAMGYLAGATYHFRVVIDAANHVYSVYVTAPGNAEVLLANGYGFRTQQAGTSSLNEWAMYAEVGSETVCNMNVMSTTSTPVAPLITSQPPGATITVGQSATFTATASGTAPLSYQWNRNGGAIAGATSATYTLASPTAADNGVQFSVTVSNTAGRVTSFSALLTVNPATATSLTVNPSSLSFGTVAIGSNSTLWATITNSGSSSVTISNVSISGAGFNASGLSSGQTIGGGQSATLNVTLAPSSTGSATGSVTIASSAANSPVTVALAGSGGPTPVQHSVSLSWSPSSSSVVGYNVYRGSATGGPYDKVTANPLAGTSYTDMNVNSGSTYYYITTSVNSTNVESAYSNEATAVIP